MTTRTRMNAVATSLAAHMGITCDRATAAPFDGGVSITFDCASTADATVAVSALRMLLARDVDAFTVDGVTAVSGTIDAATVARLAQRAA